MLLHAESWTGTGWALNEDYIVTNFHCVDGADSIVVRVDNNYTAKVIAVDEVNDLAIIRINDETVTFDEIPYSIESKQCDVGETVWTLGYPIMDIMGEDIKFTDGKISSKTGYQGELQTYQITVPIQPGNSGGALFNQYGRVVGITSSGLKKTLADNVNYAVKTNYLINLIESKLSLSILPTGSVANLPLTEQIKRISKFIYPLYFYKNISTTIDNNPLKTFPSEPICIGDLYYILSEDGVSVDVYKLSEHLKNTPISLEIPSAITYNGNSYPVIGIHPNAFRFTDISTVLIPNSVKSIGGWSFLWCSRLVRVFMPASIRSIGDFAFGSCDSLTSISISDSTRSIGSGAFSYCKHLTSIVVNSGNPYYDSRENCNSIIRTTTNTLIVGCNTSTIPNGVTSIGNNAFSCCDMITITIPNSVTLIGDEAFSYCTSLKTIVFDGTKEQWKNVIKGKKWKKRCPAKIIYMK